MSEAEIVYQMSEIYNRVWSIQQWWASMSIGLLILAHLASERLNLLLVVFIMALYSSFSLYIFNILGRNWNAIVSYIQDLQELKDTGHDLSSGTLTFLIPQSEIVTSLVIIVLISTFIGCNAYLVYSYLKVRRKRNA
jgi:hypothetical protein